jgi:hypothetical protein
VVFVTVIAALLSAEPHRPLPSHSPEALAPAGVRVHIRASEDLDPDRLRSFARAGVTLWLLTRSNLLKASTMENLNRFDAAFVQLRAPVTEAHARALTRAPRAGVWVDAGLVDAVGRVLGPRPLAVSISGALDEATAARIGAARPELTEWVAPGSIDLLAWSLFRALPGRRIVTLEQAMACSGPVEHEPAAKVHIASLLSLGGAAFPCGLGPRVVVAPDTDRWLIQSIVVRDPTAELELDVGGDEGAAKKTAALLDELGLVRR